MKFLIIPFLLLTFVILISCTNTAANDETIISNGHELIPSEPVAAPVGDVYWPQTFGWKVTEGREPLVEFTVISITRVDGVPQGWSGDYHYSFALHIDDVLLDGSTWDWPSEGEEVSIIGFASVILEEGQRYLAFINPYSLDGRIIAIINDDRSITVTISLGNYFREYDGYTVEEMIEIAEEFLVTGYTPEWWDDAATCIIDGSGALEALEPYPPDFTIVEPGGSVVIEGSDGFEIIGEAWDLDLD
ncbi:MAG: hypothetical protein LBC73_06390 [Oscillospiraceae bacterium]|jgi:hypothetical protein|nr:hypothetical protein [Oscillospiraceae bacterium]